MIELKNVFRGYGDRLLMEKLSFEAPPGPVAGIIGPDCAGKSTVLKLMTKKGKPDSGMIAIGKTVKIAHVDQSRGRTASGTSR